MTLVLTLALCLGSLGPAAAKLTGQPRMRASAEHFGLPWRAYQLIGVAELAAAAGLLVGLRWRPVGQAAAAGMGLLLVGALAFHLRARDGGKELVPAVAVLAVAVAYLAYG